MHSPVLSKGTQTRSGSLPWPWLTGQQQPWGYPGLGHQNLFYSKGYFWWGKSYSNVTRRHFSARQALPLQVPCRCCSPEQYTAWLSSAQLGTFQYLSSSITSWNSLSPGTLSCACCPVATLCHAHLIRAGTCGHWDKSCVCTTWKKYLRTYCTGIKGRGKYSGAIVCSS